MPHQNFLMQSKNNTFPPKDGRVFFRTLKNIYLAAKTKINVYIPIFALIKITGFACLLDKCSQLLILSPCKSKSDDDVVCAFLNGLWTIGNVVVTQRVFKCALLMNLGTAHVATPCKTSDKKLPLHN